MGRLERFSNAIEACEDYGKNAMRVTGYRTASSLRGSCCHRGRNAPVLCLLIHLRAQAYWRGCWNPESLLTRLSLLPDISVFSKESS
jgi:hypothetical protein